MNRIACREWNEAIAKGMSLIPPRIIERAGHFNLFVGADPVFAGLSPAEVDFGDGRNNRNTSHVLYPMHLAHMPASERVSTIVLSHEYPAKFGLWPVYVVVHEFGHILHHSLRFEWGASPTSDYSLSDYWECFAEAFAGWCWGIPVDERDQRASESDCAFFETLALGA